MIREFVDFESLLPDHLANIGQIAPPVNPLSNLF
jgi:hypothetical protein